MTPKELTNELEKRMLNQYKKDFMQVYTAAGFTPGEGWEEYKAIVFGMLIPTNERLQDESN